MALNRSHWLMIAGATLVVVLLAFAPRTSTKKAAENEGEVAAGRVSEDPNSGSTPHAQAAGEMPTSKDPEVAAILAQLSAGAPPMQTILKLRDLATKHPENIEAQYHLGLFSWQTGQYDKAMERFRTVIRMDAKGYPDAYAYLGQAYASFDSTDKAVAALETYKTLVTDTALIHGADRYIADIKKKTNPK